jgi:hypothetical protein
MPGKLERVRVFHVIAVNSTGFVVISESESHRSNFFLGFLHRAAMLPTLTCEKLCNADDSALRMRMRTCNTRMECARVPDTIETTKRPGKEVFRDVPQVAFTAVVLLPLESVLKTPSTFVNVILLAAARLSVDLIAH